MRSGKKLRGRNGKYHIAETDSIRLYGEGDPMKSKVPVHIEKENRLRRGIELVRDHGLDMAWIHIERNSSVVHSCEWSTVER